MRVLQVTNSLMSGGAEKLVVDTSILYKKKGIKVDILLLDGTITPYFKDLDAHKDITIISLGNTRKIYSPSHVFKIRNILKQYDLIHIHLFPASYWTSFANFLTGKKSKIIFTEHNTTNRRRSIFFFKWIDRFIYKQFDTIITISDAVDQSLRQHLGKKFTNLVKIYNGIDLQKIDKASVYSKKELGFEEKDILLLQVASFTPQKDQKTLLRALTHLPEGYKLLLVGQGPLEDDHKILVKELRLENRVVFMGVRRDVPSLLKSVDVVILSSNYEGLSLSSVEGMASGKPFISSEAPGLTEVVKDAGVLFKIGDSKDLSEKIMMLQSDSSYRDEIVQKCVDRSKKFDVNLMVDYYINLYRERLKIK